MVTKTKKKEVLNMTIPGGHIERLRHIKLEDLFPNPYQPDSRHQVDEETARKFGLSILEHGLLQMPVARHVLGDGATSQEQVVNGHYEVGDGWLRLAGYKWLAANEHPEYSTMPVMVRDLTDQQMADLVMEANTVRQDLTPLDLAKFYRRYLEDFGITQAELAKRHNCSQGEIANTIRLLELPGDIQEKIISREISETHGRQLLRLNQAPTLQKEMLENCGRRNFSVGELSNEIESKIWYSSKSLNPETERSYDRPVFDISGCQDCQFRTMAAQPYGNKKKEDRCLDPKCWERKNSEAIQVQVKEAWDKLKAQGIKKRLVTDEQVNYSQRETIRPDDIDNPEECEACTRTALFKYRVTDFGAPERICLDPACYRRKKTKKTRDTNKLKKEQDHELTLKLGEIFRHAHENPRGCLQVLAKHILPMLSSEGRQDLTLMFEVPKLNNGRLDIDALKVSLKDKTLDELFQLAVGTIFIKARRDDVYDNFSTELKEEQKRDIAILSGKLEEFLAEVIAFQEANCRGCRNAKENLVGTGEECCSMGYSKRLDAAGKCTGRLVQEAQEVEDDEEPSEEQASEEEIIAASEPSEAAEEEEKLIEEEHELTRARQEENIGEDEVINLPCDDCANSMTCDRSYFCTDDHGGYICDQKLPKAEAELKALEMPAEEFAATANARFQKFIKCTWCDKKFLGKFERDKEVKDSEHWRAECPDCGGITHISNRRWDGMAGIKKAKLEKLPELCSFDECTLKEACEHYKAGKSVKQCSGYETECTNYPSLVGASTISWYHCKHLPLDMWPEIAKKAKEN